MGKLKITQLRSAIGEARHFHQVLHGLGLKGPHSTTVLVDRPEIRGMVRKVLHLVKVEVCSE
ncbi:MAG: 50S ribosomal protein L30 [Deltaproteobacteria bacterium]|nr:50S ribosomal protein L30 [Deltaproteobacteria bacterium]